MHLLTAPQRPLRADTFTVCLELIPFIATEPQGKRKPKAVAQAEMGGASRTLDAFIANKVPDDTSESQDIVLNEDGTMGAAGTEESL